MSAIPSYTPLAGPAVVEILPQPCDASIYLRDLVKRFKNAAGEFSVLKGLNVDICSGEFVAVVGKSGSGKSTLLNMITGIDRPTSGDVQVGGVNIHKLNESQRALWRGRNLGIVFQFFQLLPMLSVLENTMLPMDYTNTYTRSERPQRALELLRLVGLENEADKLPIALSSGQQQSAAIARALANDPPIIVADEPTGNLDSRSADKIIQLFSTLAERGKTILIVTHDPSITGRTDRILTISDGEIIDEAIARALPMLNHRQMLNITHLIERRVFQPGAEILGQGSQVADFWVVKHGEVEIRLQSRRGSEQTVARLGPGQFFGEIELVRGGASLASVKAAPGETVELLALPRQAFFKMLADSPLTEEAIGKVVQARLTENRAAGRNRVNGQR